MFTSPAFTAILWLSTVLGGDGNAATHSLWPFSLTTWLRPLTAHTHRSGQSVMLSLQSGLLTFWQHTGAHTHAHVRAHTNTQINIFKLNQWLI